VAALATAALVLAGALFSGQSYLFCRMMERTVTACCCAPDPGQAASSGDASATIHRDCCESRSGADAAKGSVLSAAHEVPPATPGALAPALPPVTTAPAIPRSGARAEQAALRPPIRAGPGSGGHASDTCVRLQVFRC
jgi:hypothetical protein